MKQKLLSFLTLISLSIGSAHAGSIFMTGHDTLYHDGQNGYDNVIVDWLRGAGTGSEIAAANYDIAVIGSGVGSWGWTDVAGFNDRGAKPGYSSTTYYDTDDLISGSASWTDVVSADLMIILSHTTCGGCDLNDAGVAEINANAAMITAAFNTGMDLWVNSGARSASYYDFLPPGATSSGASISGSSGFTATADGTAIGIANNMINGFPTHNRFFDFDPDFTVFETRGDEVISIGIRDAIIDDGGIGKPVPEASSLALLGIGLLGISLMRRRKMA